MKLPPRPKGAETNAKGARKKEKRTMQEQSTTKRKGERRREPEPAIMTGKKKDAITCSTPLARPTVAQLRRQLQQLELPTYGRKSELVHRLKQYKDGKSTNDEMSKDEEDTDEDDKADSEAEMTNDSTTPDGSEGEEEMHIRAIRPRGVARQGRTHVRERRSKEGESTRGVLIGLQADMPAQ